jgi:acylphosphatase
MAVKLMNLEEFHCFIVRQRTNAPVRIYLKKPNPFIQKKRILSKKHYNLRITGKVQGVFFRASSRDTARDLGLSGFVRNEPDGSVYAEIEGPPEKLDRFVEWVKQGPRRANVAQVDIEEAGVKGFERFEVDR